MPAPHHHGNVQANSNGNGQANGYGQTHQGYVPPPTIGQQTSELDQEDVHETGAQGKSHSMNEIIDEARSVREELGSLLSRCSRLVSSLKRYRKQTKMVQTTLASLRQLQSIG